VGGPKRRRRRSNKLVAVAIAVAIVAGIGGGSAFAYANLKGRVDRLQAALVADLQAGQHELEAGKASLSQANSKRDATLIPEAVAHFAAARTHFMAARSLADNSRLLHDLEQIPGAGYYVYSRHATVKAVAEMGVALSEAGQELSDLDGQLIKPPGSGQAAHSLLTTIDQMQAGLLKVRLDLDRAQRAAEEVDVSLVPGGQQATFLKARNAIGAAEKGLDEFGRLVPVLKEMLGDNGPRTFLIEQVNPAELRAGGGFIGTYSLVRADHGKVTVITSGDSYDLANPRPLPGQPGFVPQPSPLRDIIPEIPWSFVDSNIFPDFPSNAKAAINFVEPRIGTPVDAVISMDYYTVAKMLELTGPLAVPGYNLSMDGSSFINQMVQREIAGDPLRKSILGAMAGPLMQRISSLTPDRWPALIAVFNVLATQRHLQAFFANPKVENELDRVGWSGLVNPTNEQHYFMEVESNYSGDKVNYVLNREYSLTLTRNGRLLHHTLTVALVNPTPAGSYDRTYYHADVRLFVDAKATAPLSNLKPVKYPNPAPPLGTKMADGWVMVECCGGQGQVTFEWDSSWPNSTLGSDRIYWQKQPGTVSDRIDVTWIDGSGRTFNVAGDLGQDRIVSLSATGVSLAPGQPAQASLPSLSLG
jgi:hypothetical protein